MKYLIYTLFFMSSDADTNVIETASYNPGPKIEINNNEISFWSSRLSTAPMTGAYKLKLAQSYEKHFHLTGDILSLTEAEELYRSCIFEGSLDHTPALLALSQNLITQHRFCEAYEAISQAESLGRDMDKVHLIKYDIEQELGIESSLNVDNINIDILIRQAKNADADGDLVQAIKYMMTARSAAYDANNRELMLWTTTNLAEFMGHNGNIETSLELLGEVLAMDPSNWYAYKLMAWIEYSHYNDPNSALSMISEIMLNRQSPELLLMSAEIAESIGLSSEIYEDRFLKLAQQPKYGRLYNMDIAEILLRKDWDDRIEGLALMKEEYEHRATPEVAALLAFAYAQNGGIIAARELLFREVYEQTFEPVPILLMLEVLKEYEDYHDYFRSHLSDTAFELGPKKSKLISNWLG